MFQIPGYHVAVDLREVLQIRASHDVPAQTRVYKHQVVNAVRALFRAAPIAPTEIEIRERVKPKLSLRFKNDPQDTVAQYETEQDALAAFEQALKTWREAVR